MVSMSGRKHRVKLNDRYSDWGLIGGDIPQGSALGPLLFLIYVNCLPSQVTDGVLRWCVVGPLPQLLLLQ